MNKPQPEDHTDIRRDEYCKKDFDNCAGHLIVIKKISRHFTDDGDS